ncbi:hypothetical protein GGR56DRAFT_491390 [Xylariaceae sp. FL0804]|nr:hypothetical protein GGR56DRAFT_491390 [Xylariaceae sp. FL0804]
MARMGDPNTTGGMMAFPTGRPAAQRAMQCRMPWWDAGWEGKSISRYRTPYSVVSVCYLPPATDGSPNRAKTSQPATPKGKERLLLTVCLSLVSSCDRHLISADCCWWRVVVRDGTTQTGVAGQRRQAINTRAPSQRAWPPAAMSQVEEAMSERGEAFRSFSTSPVRSASDADARESWREREGGARDGKGQADPSPIRVWTPNNTS